MNFNKASKHCRSMGAILAEPKTEAEHGVVMKYLKSVRSATLIWLGATDLANEGKWLWQSDSQPISYNKWRHGSPATTETYDCLLLGPLTGFFYDMICRANTNIEFLCQEKLQGNWFVC